MNHTKYRIIKLNQIFTQSTLPRKSLIQNTFIRNKTKLNQVSPFIQMKLFINFCIIMFSVFKKSLFTPFFFFDVILPIPKDERATTIK